MTWLRHLVVPQPLGAGWQLVTECLACLGPRTLAPPSSVRTYSSRIFATEVYNFEIARDGWEWN